MIDNASEKQANEMSLKDSNHEFRTVAYLKTI